MELKELTEALESARIDTESWGKDGRRSVADLLEELNAGMSRLVINKGLVRYVQTIPIYVLHEEKGGPTWRLLPAEQKGGGQKYAEPATLVQRISREDMPLERAHHMLKEELGFEREQVLVSARKPRFRMRAPSPSFQGLRTTYAVFPFSCRIPDSLFKREGYTRPKKAGGEVAYLWTPHDRHLGTP